MWTYSILWPHTVILKRCNFCLHAPALIQYKKLKTRDRVKTRNTSFIPSFMTQCSLPALSFLVTLSCFPYYMWYLLFWDVYLFTHVHVYGTGNDPQRIHRIFLRLSNLNIIYLFFFAPLFIAALSDIEWNGTNRPPSTDKWMAKICIYKFYSTLKKN